MPNNTNKKRLGQVYDTYTLLEAYSSLISSELDGILIHLQGFYLDRKGKLYGKFYYDALSDQKTNNSITLQINEELKATFVDGGFYQMQGFINRGRLKEDFGLRMVFYVTKVEKHEKDVQLISEHQYNLIKSRFDKGMVNIESLLLDQLYDGKKTKIAFLTGDTSIVDKDFFDQLESDEHYDIEVIRVNLSTKTELLEVIGNWEDQVDILAFVRGGGSGLLLFDEEDLCTKILALHIPIVTAIGHEVDQQLLSKIADRSFATPTAFGAFLEKLVWKDRERKEEVSILEYRISTVQRKMDEKLAETTKSYEFRLQKAISRSKVLSWILAGFVLLVVGVLFYFKN